MKKRCLSALLAALCSLSLLVPAVAAEAKPTNLHLSYWRERLYVEDVLVGFWDSEGRQREALVYNGTVYIPLRTAGEWMGAEVVWNQSSLTVSLTANRAQPRYTSLTTAQQEAKETAEERAQYALDLKNGVDAELRPDISVTLDGEVQRFTNAAGAPVYPLLFRQCVYLPVRSIGELCGKEVLFLTWSDEQGPLCRIHIYDAPTGAQLEATETFYRLADQYTGQLEAGIAALSANKPANQADFWAALRELKATATQITDLSLPSANVLRGPADAVQDWAREIMEKDLDPYLFPDKLMLPSFAAKDWSEHWAALPENFKGEASNLTHLHEMMTFGRLLLDAVRTQAAGRLF